MRNHAGADNGSSRCEMALALKKENTGSGRSDRPAYWYAQAKNAEDIFFVLQEADDGSGLYLFATAREN